MEDSFYSNLLRATDNTNDITTEKYAIVTKKNTNNTCSVKETDNGLEHHNVPILNGIPIKTGDSVVIGFVNNSIYNVITYGVLDRAVTFDADSVVDSNAYVNLEISAGSTQKEINMKVNEKIGAIMTLIGNCEDLLGGD